MDTKPLDEKLKELALLIEMYSHISDLYIVRDYLKSWLYEDAESSITKEIAEKTFFDLVSYYGADIEIVSIAAASNLQVSRTKPVTVTCEGARWVLWIDGIPALSVEFEVQ